METIRHELAEPDFLQTRQLKCRRLPKPREDTIDPCHAKLPPAFPSRRRRGQLAQEDESSPKGVQAKMRQRNVLV